MTFPWEFGYLVDERLRDTGFAVVRGRLESARQFEFLESLARDHLIIGMTCQSVFPMIGDLPGTVPRGEGPREGRHEPYLSLVGGWAHCFREPDEYLPPRRPRIQFANSDNMNADRIWQVATSVGPRQKTWDYVYSCMPEPANVARKNRKLARRCALLFAEELGLRGLLVGVLGLDDVPAHPLIEVRPELKWAEFLSCVLQSRVALFPNTWDPSPRLIAEALCLDVPVLVNHRTLGGWQYVCDHTGRFFNDERDALDAMMSLLSDRFAPREWYCAHHGFGHAGPRLAAFLRQMAAIESRAGARETVSFYSPRDWGGAYPKPRASD
jgi:hypothetical protein